MTEVRSLLRMHQRMVVFLMKRVTQGVRRQRFQWKTFKRLQPSPSLGTLLKMDPPTLWLSR